VYVYCERDCPENFGLTPLLSVAYYSVTSSLSVFCRFKKFGVPRPETYQAENQPTSKMKRRKSRGTNRIPSSDGREPICAAARVRARCNVLEAHESVAVQPGIEEAKWALPIRNHEVIKQRDYARHGLYIVVSWVLGADQRGEGKRTGAAQLVPVMGSSLLFTTIRKFSACAAMSGIPRPAALHIP